MCVLSGHIPNVPSRNCRCTQPNEQIFCPTRNPGTTAPAYGLTMWLRISSWYSTAVSLPLNCHERVCVTLQSHICLFLPLKRGEKNDMRPPSALPFRRLWRLQALILNLVSPRSDCFCSHLPSTHFYHHPPPQKKGGPPSADCEHSFKGCHANCSCTILCFLN